MKAKKKEKVIENKGTVVKKKRPPRKRFWNYVGNMEADIRVWETVSLYIQWYPTREIYIKLKEKFNLEPRTVDRYIKQAKLEVTKQIEFTTIQEVNMHQNRYLKLYNEAFKSKNYAVCNNILKNIATLKWLEAPKRQVSLVKIQTEDVIKENDDTVRKYLQENSIEINTWDAT